jgi:hypothetical protein
MRKNDKKTQVETYDKFILAANTEDLKLKNHNKFKEPKPAEISANCRLLQERDVEIDVRARVERAARLCYTPSPELPQTRVTPRQRSSTSSRTTLPRSELAKSPKLAQTINLFWKH